MDSINNQQVEENRKDLSGPHAVEQLKAIVDKAPSCFFWTAPATAPSPGVRPMSVQKMDDEGRLWFLSANDSHKNQEIADDGEARLYFQGSAHGDFLFVDGEATISTDPEKIKELWEPLLKTWFTGGIEDPRITVICFAPASGYYWATKHGGLVAGAKIIIGAALGKTMDDSIEGSLTF